MSSNNDKFIDREFDIQRGWESNEHNKLRTIQVVDTQTQAVIVRISVDNTEHSNIINNIVDMLVKKLKGDTDLSIPTYGESDMNKLNRTRQEDVVDDHDE